MSKWNLIKGYEQYMINDKGIILSVIGNKLKQYDNQGYKKVYLGRKSFSVHRLIAQAFLVNPHEYPQVNHINGKKDDNRIKNLEWCTHLQNHQHATRIGLKGGERNGTTKLTKEDVIFIRKNYPKVSQYKLASKFGVSRRSIRDIISGRNWKPQTLK